MDTKRINFINNKTWLKEDSEFRPTPSTKNISQWYKDADRFLKDPHTDDFYVSFDKGKIPTWKACPALLDVATSGYYFLTPCDIEFYIDSNNKLSCSISEDKYKDFCTPRQEMDQFYRPDGYDQNHFAWLTDWGVQLPEGYSALYLQPINRFELPFLSTSGTIDNDKLHNSGSIPFFIKEGWTGVVKAGTPYMQIIPFKRENWQASFTIKSGQEIQEYNNQVSKKYRVPDGGVYQRDVWEKRVYE